MSDILSKIEILRTRCSGFAEEFLRELEPSPTFPQILDKLMELQGPIARADIERALLELTRERQL